MCLFPRIGIELSISFRYCSPSDPETDTLPFSEESVIRAWGLCEHGQLFIGNPAQKDEYLIMYKFTEIIYSNYILQRRIIDNGRVAIQTVPREYVHAHC